MVNRAEQERRFDVMERTIDSLRRQVAELRHETLGEGGNDSTRRALRFLKAFYDAPGHRLVASDASLAATAAGIDARGTAGFDNGKNGSLHPHRSLRHPHDPRRD